MAIEASNDPEPDNDLWIANAGGSSIAPLNLGVNVARVGTSWGLIPGDIVLPTAPVSFAEAAG